MAEIQFGGRITFEFAGQILSMEEASVQLIETGYKADAASNQDGSVFYTYTPQPYGADIKFRDDASITWDTMMRAQGNCTITELDNGVTHLFTECRMTGDPKVDRTKGTVDGVQIRGGHYQKLTGQS
jgi:hypothetical protein